MPLPGTLVEREAERDRFARSLAHLSNEAFREAMEAFDRMQDDG